MRYIILMILSLYLTVSKIEAQEIRVAAAGSLRYILGEIIEAYGKTDSKTKIVPIFSSSGALYQQISNGATFDIFMSADSFFPNQLKSNGMTDGEVKTYALGKLVLWSNIIDIQTLGIDALTDKSVRRIAIVKPKIGPYGAKAMECISYYGLEDEVKPKLVYAETVVQAAQFARTGNADLCFISLSVAIAPEMKGHYISVNPKSYSPVEQCMVLVKNNSAISKQFMDFVLSKKCKPIFEKHGFEIPIN